MKRFSKILAFTLLLAVVVSVFAVLPAFAETNTATDADEIKGIYTSYDFDKTNAGKTSVSMSVKTSSKIIKNEDGTWRWTYEGVPSPSGDNYLEILGTEVFAFLDSPLGTVDITLDDKTVVQKTSGTGKSRNTKYVVVDMDVLMGDDPIDWNINARLTNALSPNYNSRYSIKSSKSTKNYAVGASLGSSDTHPRLRMASYGQPYITNESSGNYAYNANSTSAGWHHVTLIYDVSGEYNADGTFDNSHWAIHAYIDGMYANKIATISPKTARLWFMRWGDNSTKGCSSFANLTVKRFGTDYNGALDNGNIIGNSAITLADVPELAYCMEDIPGGDDVIAKVTSADGTVTEYTQMIKLNSALKNGDTLELCTNLNRTLLVEGSGAVDVTVIDNGFTVPQFILVNPEETDFVVQKTADGSLITSGKQSYTYSKIVTTTTNTFYADDETKMSQTVHKVYTDVFTGDCIGESTDTKDVKRETSSKEGTTSSTKYDSTDAFMDALYANRTTGVISTFFNDVTITSAKDGTVPSRNVNYIDLNDKVITIAPSSAHMFKNTYSNVVRIIFMDGDIVYKPYNATNNLVMTGTDGANNGVLCFEGVDIDVKSGVLIDQRQGVFYFKDCIIDAASTIVSSKSYTDHVSAVILDNTQVNATQEVFSIRNLSNKYPSITNYFAVRNGSSFSTSGAEVSFITIDPYYFKNYTVNDNYVWIYIKDSDITASHRIVDIFTHDNGKDNQITVDIDVVHSNLSSSGIVWAGNIANSTEPYNYEVNVNVIGNSKIRSTGSTSAVIRHESSESVLNLYLEEGTQLSKAALHRSDCATDNLNITLGDGTDAVKVVSTGADPDFPYVVTSNYKTWTYMPYGATEPTEILWAGDTYPTLEEFNNGAPKPATTATTTYRYKEVDGVYVAEFIPAFPLKANLTLSESISINVFIPTSVGSVEVVGLTIDGEAYTGKADVVELADGNKYFKVVVSGITPTKAMEMYEIGFTVADMNGVEKTFSKSISVVDYLENVYNSGSDQALVEKIFTYVALAAAYAEEPVTITSSTLEVGTPTGKAYEEAQSSIGLTLSLNLEDGYRWVIEDLEAGEAVVVKYNVNGTLTEKTLTADANGTITFSVKACDLLDAVTVGDKTFTFENYAAAVFKSENSDNATKTLINAIYDYAYAVDSYNN